METIQASIESSSHSSEVGIEALRRTLDTNDAQTVLNDAPVELIVQTIRKLYVAQHSLGILYLLTSQIKSIPEAAACGVNPGTRVISPIATEFFNDATAFLIGFQPNQVRGAPTQFAKLCRAYVNVSIHLNNSIKAIWPLQQALFKLESPSNRLTPLHACVVLACLHSKCYFAAIDLLEKPILQVTSRANAMEDADVLMYYYYGAMIYIGMKDFESAKGFLHTAITLPSRCLSAIVIAAFKKYVLVCLILTSKAVESPKLMSSVVHRHLKGQCKAYFDLMKAFEMEDDIPQCIATYESEFRESSHLGLVKQALEALKCRKIQRLTHTYVTLSLSDIAAAANVPNPLEAERYVLRMIETREVYAKIDKRNDMVTFTDDHETFDNLPILERLHGQIKEIIDFSAYLSSMDAELSCEPQYLLKLSSQGRRPSATKWSNEWQDPFESMTST